MKLKKTLKVKNKLGLHVRPAASIVKLLQTTKSMVSFTYKDQTINAKSIMSILTLAAKKNSSIQVTIEGTDAKSVLNKLTKCFENGFGE